MRKKVTRINTYIHKYIQYIEENFCQALSIQFIDIWKYYDSFGITAGPTVQCTVEVVALSVYDVVLVGLVVLQVRVVKHLKLGVRLQSLHLFLVFAAATWLLVAAARQLLLLGQPAVRAHQLLPQLFLQR